MSKEGILPSPGKEVVKKDFTDIVGGGSEGLMTLRYIGNCQGEKCMIAHICSVWNKTGNEDIGELMSRECPVEKLFMDGVEGPLLTALGSMPDDDEVRSMRIGMHVVPLYQMLFKMYLLQMSLGSLVSQNKQGTIQMHPVLKEIRETLKTIGYELDRMGWQYKQLHPEILRVLRDNAVLTKKYGIVFEGGEDGVGVKMVSQANYYDVMASGGDEV